MKSQWILIMASFFSGVVSYSTHAGVYKWTDEQGRVHFSDSKPGQQAVEEVELKINTYTAVTYEESIFSEGPKVVMYSTQWCGYCKKARQYFKQNHIAYTEYDIEKDAGARRRHKQMGAKGVPVILVGKRRMNGFSVQGFERIYQH